MATRVLIWLSEMPCSGVQICTMGMGVCVGSAAVSVGEGSGLGDARATGPVVAAKVGVVEERAAQALSRMSRMRKATCLE